MRNSRKQPDPSSSLLARPKWRSLLQKCTDALTAFLGGALQRKQVRRFIQQVWRDGLALDSGDKLLTGTHSAWRAFAQRLFYLERPRLHRFDVVHNLVQKPNLLGLRRLEALRRQEEASRR